MKKTYFIFCILIALFAQFKSNAENVINPVSTASPKKGIITGKVLDKNGSPIEYANLIIYKKRDSSMVTGTISKFDGSFEINDIPPGKYYLTANFIGYNKELIDNISIFPDNLKYHTGIISLSVSTTAIDGVEVRADRVQVEYKLDKKIVHVSQDATSADGTAVDVLENTPSVTVDMDGNVALRGSGNFTVLIDGKPSVLSGTDALEQIPSSAIENIEIITNPSAKYDPDGTAGILNVILKRNALQGLSGLFNLTIGTNDKYRGDGLLSYKTNKATFMIGLDYRDETRLGNMENNRTIYNNITEYYMYAGNRDGVRSGYNLKGGFDYNFTDKTSVSFQGNIGNYGRERNSQLKTREWTSIEPDIFYTKKYDVSDRSSDYYKLNLNLRHNFNGPEHYLNAYIEYSDREGGEIEYKDFYYSDIDWEQYGLYDLIQLTENEKDNNLRFTLDYTRPYKKTGKIEAGYQLRIDDDNEGFTFEELDTTKLVAGQSAHFYHNSNEFWVSNDLYTGDFSYNRVIHSAYSTFANKFAGFEYMLGLRVEYTNRNIEYTKALKKYEYEKFDFFPTIHVSKKLENNHQLMASYSKRINRPRGWNLEPFPSLRDRNSMRFGNPNLEPEYTNSYELGYQKRLGNSYIAFEGFYRYTINKITRFPRSKDSIFLARELNLSPDQINSIPNDAFIMTFENLDKDLAMGAEISGNYDAAKWLNIYASTSLYKYKLESNLENNEGVKETTNFDGRMNVTFKLPSKTRIQLSGFYRGPSITATGNRSSFMAANFAVRQEFLDRRLTATLNIKDVFASMKFKFDSYIDNVENYFVFYREPQVITLSLSYKLNNYKKKQNGNGDENGNGGTMDDF